MKIIFVNLCKLYIYFGEKKDAHYTALLLVSLLIFINAYSVLSAIELFLFPEIEYRYYLLFILQIIILILNFYIFIFRKKHVDIIENYKEKRRKFKYLDIFLTIGYIVISVIVWIYLGSQLRELNLNQNQISIFFPF